MHFLSKYWLSNRTSEKGSFQASFIAKAVFLVVFVHFIAQANFLSTSLSEILGLEAGPAKSYIHTNQSTSQHGTTLPIAELLKGNELQEKPPLYKDYNFYSSLALIKSAAIGASENLRLHFLRSLQNRPTLSLFILHHSWKSYLS